MISESYQCRAYMPSASDMLLELARREKEHNIRPDPAIDAYMKV